MPQHMEIRVSQSFYFEACSYIYFTIITNVDYLSYDIIFKENIILQYLNYYIVKEIKM